MIDLSALPDGLHRTTITLADGTQVGIILNWGKVRAMTRTAARNRTRTSTSGPIIVVLPKELPDGNS